MNRTVMHLIWGTGLVFAAYVLGNKESNPLPYAAAALGGWVAVGAYLVGLYLDKLDDDAEERARPS